MSTSDWDGNATTIEGDLSVSNLPFWVRFFVVLRKHARKLENEIDIKLVAYSKLGCSPVLTTSVDTAPLLGEQLFESLSIEIEQMLDKVHTI